MWEFFLPFRIILKITFENLAVQRGKTGFYLRSSIWGFLGTNYLCMKKYCIWHNRQSLSLQNHPQTIIWDIKSSKISSYKGRGEATQESSKPVIILCNQMSRNLGETDQSWNWWILKTSNFGNYCYVYSQKCFSIMSFQYLQPHPSQRRRWELCGHCQAFEHIHWPGHFKQRSGQLQNWGHIWHWGQLQICELLWQFRQKQPRSFGRSQQLGQLHIQQRSITLNGSWPE